MWVRRDGMPCVSKVFNKLKEVEARSYVISLMIMVVDLSGVVMEFRTDDLEGPPGPPPPPPPPLDTETQCRVQRALQRLGGIRMSAEQYVFYFGEVSERFPFGKTATGWPPG